MNSQRARPRLPADKLELLGVFGLVELAASKALIENVERCRASFADGRPIRHPDNDGCQSDENDQRDNYVHSSLREVSLPIGHWRIVISAETGRLRRLPLSGLGIGE